MTIEEEAPEKSNYSKQQCLSDDGDVEIAEIQLDDISDNDIGFRKTNLLYESIKMNARDSLFLGFGQPADKQFS